MRSAPYRVLSDDPLMPRPPEATSLDEILDRLDSDGDDEGELGLRSLLAHPEALSRAWWREEQRRSRHAA